MFFARITADFSVATADTYTFRTYNDDGVFLRIDNTLVISDTGYHPEQPFNGSIALSPGNHSIEMFFFEYGGEASLEFSVRNSTGSFGLVGASGGGLGGVAQLTDSGTLSFSDVDLTDAHLVSAIGTPIGSVLGSLSAVKNSDTTGSGTGGQLTWTYTVANSAVEYLAAGQAKIESFTVTLNDQHGGLITKQIDVTITGSNDVPVVVAADVSGAVTEAIAAVGNLTDSGAIGFTDVDLTDIHSLSAIAPSSGTLGTLTASVSTDTTGSGLGGVVSWNYSVAAAAVEYLAAGQTKVETFGFNVLDGQGGSVPRTVSVTVTGTNDAPVAANDTASTAEDTAVTIAVLGNDTDVDAGDTKALVSATGAQHGALALSGGNVVYTPSPNYNGADSFSYTMQDAAGATSTATVSVNVTPVNDTYVLSNLIVNGSFEQMGSGDTNGGSTAITGWTVTGSDIDRVASSGWQTADGTYSLDMNGFHPGGVQQTFATIAGVQYTVGFSLSKNPGNSTYATLQASAAGTTQDYTYNLANSGTNMKWSQQILSFTATGSSTTLEFKSIYPTDATGGFPINAQGPALDEVVVVSNKVINNFTEGTGGDVLNLHDLLTSVGAPHDSTAFSGGFLQFLQSGNNTLVQVDANGGGDAYITLATLTGQLLTPLDTQYYVL